jgi:hypothetical protein
MGCLDKPNSMTQKERERMAGLEDAVIDRERRLLGYASIIQAMTKGNYDPMKVKLNVNLTPNEAQILGITDWQACIADKEGAG